MVVLDEPIPEGARPDTRRARRDASGVTWAWVVMVFMLTFFCLIILGGLVALAYSPLVKGFFGMNEEQPAAFDQSENVPAPDNTISRVPEDFEQRAEHLVGDADVRPNNPPAEPFERIPGLDTPAEEPR